MMWIPLRSVRMKRLTFGFHRRVWGPRGGPAPEVDAAVEQLANGDDGHGRAPVPGARPRERKERRFGFVPRPVGRGSWCPARSRLTRERGPMAAEAWWAREVTPLSGGRHPCYRPQRTA